MALGNNQDSAVAAETCAGSPVSGTTSDLNCFTFGLLGESEQHAAARHAPGRSR
jgi:hypothetical protein